jgi:hypothetical protein
MPFVDEMPTRQLTPPGEDGEWFEVRLLSWKEIDECRREQGRKMMGRVREMGPELLRAVADIEAPSGPRSSGDAGVAEAGASGGAEAGADEAERELQQKAIAILREENRKAEALEAFDRELLVTKSVVGWSYATHFQSTRLNKLDEATFTWLFEAIAAMYVGDDAQRKAVSASSSTTSTETDLAQTPST